MVTRISVVEAAEGRSCISHEAGDRVYQRVRPALDQGDTVELSFKDVGILTSMFLNAAVGRLYDDFEYDHVDKRVVPVEIEDRHQRTWSRAMKQAKKYFDDPARFERARREAFDVSADAR